MKVQTYPCQVCGDTTIIDIPEEGFNKWRNGAFIQDAFPTLSPDERELLISGTHPKCWDELFLDED